jgi:hypothetical protein
MTVKVARARFVIVFAMCVVTHAYGQEKTTDVDIVTDRPDVTESSIVIPRGSFQLENGLTWTGDHGDTSVDFTETLMRFGVSSHTEFRLVVPNYVAGISGSAAPSGFGDIAVGAKQQIGPLRRDFDLAVIVALSLPTGADRISSRGFDPFIKVPWSKEISKGWSIGGMQSFFWNTQDERRNPTWETTFTVDKEITESLSAFVEYAGDFARHGGSQQIAHFGAAYRVTPKQQIDCHFGFGLSAATPDHLFAFGYSIRLDNLLWTKRTQIPE